MTDGPDPGPFDPVVVARREFAVLLGPARVAFDAGSAEGGVSFPPVVVVAPDAVAVDLGGMR
ncbi:hypothetical protein OG211_12715 [Streptomyces niveus]|uniref:hypothetical protein n=1 Tax=Streptomyces niveus TaxID=193462 RepID=UPI0034331085|nr:hypothetical protein OG211_12715 [Streptomyces niveus]